MANYCAFGFSAHVRYFQLQLGLPLSIFVVVIQAWHYDWHVGCFSQQSVGTSL